MATRSLTNVEALPALRAARARALGGAWRYGACAASARGLAERWLLDAVDAGRGRGRARSSARATRASCGSRRSGSSSTAALVLLFLRFRGHVRLASAGLGARRRALGLDGDRARLDDRARPPDPPPRGRGRPGVAVAEAAGLQRGLPGRRAASRSTGRSSRRAATGELAKPTLIVGAGRIGQLAAERLLEHPGARAAGRSASSTRSRSTRPACPCRCSARAGTSSG